MVAPGIKGITGIETRVSGGGGGEPVFDDPVQLDPIETSFPRDEKRGKVSNCLIASNPSTFCDSARGSGKRVKSHLTGRVPFDMRLSTTPGERGDPLSSQIEYFSFGKMTNKTGARMTGFSIELRDSNGNLMDDTDPENAVLFDLNNSRGDTGHGVTGNKSAQAKLSGGMFSDHGGNEGNIGFFSSEDGDFTSDVLDAPAAGADGFVPDADKIWANKLDFGVTNSPDYIYHFGSAFVADWMVPDALFWDDGTADPDSSHDEGAMIAWNDLRQGRGWTYGQLEQPGAALDARLEELADALGVDVAALQYDNGDLVPDEIVAAMQANGLFEIDEMDDLANANLNYSLSVGNIEDGEFTVRMAPRFAPIVENTRTPYQWHVAGYLDGVAEVPYLDIGNAAEYQDEITRMLALDAPEQAEALERTGFSFLGAFSGLGMNLGRDQVFALGRPNVEMGNDGITLSSKSDASWAMGEHVRGFAVAQGNWGSYDTTANGIGYDVDTYGISAGIEAKINPALSIGVMVSGLDGEAKAYNSRGKVDASGVSMALFGRAAFGQGGSVQAMVGYQDLSFDTKRNVSDLVAKASPDGSQTFFALQADYMFRQGALTWGPMASVEHYKLKVDAFNETGAGAWNMSVDKQDGSVTLASAGVRGEYHVNAAGTTRVYGSLAWTKASGDDAFISTGFTGLPTYVTPVDGIDQDWVDVNLGVTTPVSLFGNKETYLGAEYRGSIGSNYENHGVGVFVKMAF